MTVTAAMKQEIEQRVRKDIATLEAKHNVKIKMPVIRYDLRGTTAGTANYGTWVIKINPVLLVENYEDMLNDTVPHELCHLATHIIYPEAHQRGWGQKRSPHGWQWKSLMMELGVNPTRTHRYNVDNARVKNRVRYDYRCTGCDAILSVGPKHHAKLQSGVHLWHKSCKQYKLVLVTNSTPAVKVAAQSKESQPKPTKKPVTRAGESKLAKCEGWYQYYKNESPDNFNRALIINVFINECECTPAGAATYYATCKKKYG